MFNDLHHKNTYTKMGVDYYILSVAHGGNMGAADICLKLDIFVGLEMIGASVMDVATLPYFISAGGIRLT